jgi:diguanylate cyclase (GGDEF)-like protein
MSAAHPKLIEIVVDQTPRAMIAMLIVSAAYFWTFVNFIPLFILVVWFLFQVSLATYRLHNAKKFKESLEENNFIKSKRNEVFFMISNVFQAAMWTVSSVLCVIYAPQPYELVSFVIIIGVITAAALSMSSLYKAYLIFFFSMIIPQIIILAYYGEHQHIALVVFSIIYIPATILLSKTIYNSRLSSIEAHSELEESVYKLHQLSITDNLTNIYNRRYFLEISKNFVAKASREKNKVSLLMLDVDYFKSVNDNYGHQAGDFVLIYLVKEINKTIRENDIFARVGGEEFTILLSNTPLYGAQNIAEKIRKIIEDKIFIYNSVSIKITVSIGISELNAENTSIEALYKEADKQLYAAKENGRNRVSS